MPDFTGDWYFTGRYPTPGGYRVLNRSYLDWRRDQDVRAYEEKRQGAKARWQDGRRTRRLEGFYRTPSQASRNA